MQQVHERLWQRLVPPNLKQITNIRGKGKLYKGSF